MKNGDLVQFGTDTQIAIEVCLGLLVAFLLRHLHLGFALECSSPQGAGSRSLVLHLQLIPVLTESVTVQQYLEAETQRQVQSIKVRCPLHCACINSIRMRCFLDTRDHASSALSKVVSFTTSSTVLVTIQQVSPSSSQNQDLSGLFYFIWPSLLINYCVHMWFCCSFDLLCQFPEPFSDSWLLKAVYI